MAEINPLGTSYYYSGVQNASSSIKKEEKSEKTNKARKSTFIDFLKKADDEQISNQTASVLEKAASMPLEEAIVFLKDRVDISGDKFSASMTTENMEEFRQSVKDFILFVVDNNFAVTTKQKKGMVPSHGYFSNYQLPPHKKNPRVQIEVINKKVDELTRVTLNNQKDRLVMLGKINEIKGLIVDFMSS